MRRPHLVALLFGLASACYFAGAFVGNAKNLVLNLGLGVTFLVAGLVWWREATARARWRGDAVGLPGPGTTTVALVGIGPDKLASLAALRRAVPRLSLAEAKGIVDDVQAGKDAILTRGATPGRAEAIRAALEAVGASVRVTAGESASDPS